MTIEMNVAQAEKLRQLLNEHMSSDMVIYGTSEAIFVSFPHHGKRFIISTTGVTMLDTVGRTKPSTGTIDTAGIPHVPA